MYVNLGKVVRKIRNKRVCKNPKKCCWLLYYIESPEKSPKCNRSQRIFRVQLCDSTDFCASPMTRRLTKSVFVLEYEIRNERFGCHRLDRLSGRSVRFFGLLVEKKWKTRREKENAYEVRSKRIHHKVSLLKKNKQVVQWLIWLKKTAYR